jgi:SAM-dependent methyltransferase
MFIEINDRTEHNKSIKSFSLLRKISVNYNPNDVNGVISPSETMVGDNYMWVGASAAEVIMKAIAVSRLTEVCHVLDLPCGHGRVLRHLIKMFPDAEFDACDLDKMGVDFCKDHFNARAIYSEEDLTKVSFSSKYDLIWVGSLFTHTSKDIMRRWLSFLTGLLKEDGIIISTHHGRWSTELHKIVPYIDNNRWSKIISEYEKSGYGYHDYGHNQSHGFIKGSYGLSVAKPTSIVDILERVPNTRILMYQERAWGNNHDVVVLGTPSWSA